MDKSSIPYNIGLNVGCLCDGCYNSHMIGEILKKLVKKALGALSIPFKDNQIHLDHPSDLSHGDFSTNVAMVLAKEVKDNPKELAEKLAEKMNKIKGSEIEKVEVAGAGFINFFLSKKFLRESIERILKEGEKYGSNNTLKGKKVIVEYTDPNPFKEFHIGHLMSNSIGEALSRILEFQGAEVIRANYQGDVGLHVAQAMWGMLEMKDSLPKDTDDISVRAKFLGKAYSYGVKAYEEDKKIQGKIKEINKHLYEEDSVEINDLYNHGKKWSSEYFEIIYRRLGTHFDTYYFESGTGGVGRRIVEENLNTIFKDSQGAIVFPAEEYDPKLHTRVFITSQGLPTYEAKELGLAKMKFDEHPHDLSFVVTGNEIVEYFKVTLKALEQIYPDIAAKIKHIPHGMLRLKEGKMSSRTGDVITAQSLLDNIVLEVLKKMTDTEMGKEEKERVADMIAVGAVKYSILKQASGRDIIFDFDTALSFEGDSGPYVQYTYARAKSLLRKAGDAKLSVGEFVEENDVERILYRFPLIVSRAENEYESHHIATYLFLLARSFNTYYAQEKILDKSDKQTYRLALTQAVATVLKNGLWLLGIEAPERM